jgi:hypothetical protein
MRRFSVALLYLLVSLLVFAVWSRVAKTEALSVAHPPALKGHPSAANLGAMIDGTAEPPFVWRRLLPDTAFFLAHAIPTTAWEQVTAWVESDAAGARVIKRAFDSLEWPRERYPELICGYFLIWVSVLGFMIACRWLATLLYDLRPRVADLTGILFGIALLGGAGRTWESYPYDLPNAFLFTTTLAAIVARRWWMPLAFVLACYSKETSLLLILAYVLVHGLRWRRRGWWLMLAALSAVYLGFRYWIVRVRYDVPGAERWWFPDRNLLFLARGSVYYLWLLLPAAVVLTRIGLMWRQIPLVLRRLLPLGVLLVGAAFCKGWIEERRCYLEMLPIIGLIFCQWAAVELGLEHLFVPRRDPPKSAAVSVIYQRVAVLPSGGADQDAGEKDEHAADHHLEDCRGPRRLHEPVSNPGDHR